jgi:hypothetical protein
MLIFSKCRCANGQPSLQMGDRKGRPYIVLQLRHCGALRFGYVGATLAVALFAVMVARLR